MLFVVSFYVIAFYVLAIYGVALPPGFDQFSSSDNFYAGANINPYASLSVTNGAQPSELLTLGSGT